MRPVLVLAAVCSLFLTTPLAAQEPTSQPNFLIITADDMNWDSLGCYGCPLKDVSPSIDHLASRGMRFHHAHVASTACYPSRSAISTGRRGHRSGGEGFFHLRFPDIPTVQQLLHHNGYRVGILGKVSHSTPYEDTPWDVAKEMGRDTNEFAKEAASFVDDSVSAEKPFYMIVNSHDPHRPYYNIDKGGKTDGDEPSRVYQPGEIPVHPTIPDHPAVRHEQACYFSSVRRCDDVVASMVKLLEDRKLTENTMIVFLSDHGMAVPSAKSNCYVQSTRTPFIVRWDGRVESGQVDTEHMISSMDILPTILDAAKIKNPGGMDGRTLWPMLNGKSQDNRDHIFTQYYMKIGKTNYQMRAWQDTNSMYLFNPWHNGKPVYNTSSMGGECFKAMLAVGKTEPVWAKRAEYLLTRVPEEFFDLQADPHCINNLIDDPACKRQIAESRSRMAAHLKSSEDPMSEVFDVYQQTKSVDQLIETYAAMWDKHGIPGRIASNPVDMSKWDGSAKEDKNTKSPKPSPKTDEQRKTQRAARRAAEKAEQVE